MSDYKIGFLDGVRAYAWYKDGAQQVGTTGRTLKEALAKVEQTWNYAPPTTFEPQKAPTEPAGTPLFKFGSLGADFSVAYLDGVMKGEPREIRQHWTYVRAAFEKAERELAEAIRRNERNLIEWTKAERELSQAKRDAEREPVWIVNDLGELGVKIGHRFLFLYKGDNLEYETGKHDDGSQMMWRIVGKREFGECCYPLRWITNRYSEDRYRENPVFTPGLSFGKPEDGEWKPLPAALAKREGEES